MNKLKFNRPLIIFAVFYAVLIICIMLLVTGVVSPFVACYAVDSSDWLYIQDGEFIKIYANGTIIGQIDAPTGRDYRFTIENDTIMLATPVRVHIMKLDGSEIEAYDDPGANTFVKIDSPTKEYTCDNTVYVLNNGKLIGQYSESEMQLPEKSDKEKLEVFVDGHLYKYTNGGIERISPFSENEVVIELPRKSSIIDVVITAIPLIFLCLFRVLKEEQ